MTNDLPKYFQANGWDLRVEGGHGEYWLLNGADRKFVARFKYKSPMANLKHFAKFLTANFTVSEYFALTDRSGKDMAPVTAIETKGYVPYNVLQIAKRYGNSALAGTRWAV